MQRLKASKEVKEKIAKEISRFKRLSTNSAESGVERAYIETLLELPWDKTSPETSDLTRAEEILDRDHYGLEQVKERMLEFLAVRALTKQGESPIICLVGPPGTGKTSIARGVAEALNKNTSASALAVCGMSGDPGTQKNLCRLDARTDCQWFETGRREKPADAAGRGG